MAITTKQKEKFIELRAEGLSFDSISEKLKISKPTLLKMGAELDNEISNFRYLIYDTMLEQYKLSLKHKVEVLCKQIEKVNTEIDKKDFSTLSVKELFNIRGKLLTEFNQLIEDVNYSTGEFQADIFEGMDFGRKEITIPLC